MAVKVLEFDRGIIPQVEYWSCGSASTEVALAVRGVYVPERELFGEVGTTVNGTDHISQIVRVLNRRLNAGYVIQECPNDPPSQAMRDKLWRDIVGSINAGFAVVCNIVSPPSNRPRAVKGGQSPNYGWSTIWHYFSVIGFDDADRTVEIADSGFAPYHFWVTLDNLAELIPPKGYAFVPGVDATPAPAAPGLTAEVLAEAMGGSLPIERYLELLPAFADAMLAAGCTTVERAAMWCAQIGHESAGLRYMEEIADGSAYNGRADLGNTQPGDGPRFKGSGPVQLTGRSNFRRFSEWCHSRGLVGSPSFFEDNPQLVRSDPRWGFLAATWYWVAARPQINELCDKRDIVGVTRAINGGVNGLPDRQLRYQRCLNLGAALLPSTSSEGGFTVADADRVIEHITKFLGPIGSDVKDVRGALLGDRDNPDYPEPQKTVTGFPSLYDVRAGKSEAEAFRGSIPDYVREVDAKCEALIQITAALASAVEGLSKKLDGEQEQA